jgi:hydroxyacylglutathione hydrolase
VRLTNEVYLIGGGDLGFGLSGSLDCHVYAIDGGDEVALVDCGLGEESAIEDILRNLRTDGIDPSRVRKLILTHYHVDHCGGASALSSLLGLEVLASQRAAPAIRSADEDAVGLNVAKRARYYPESYRMLPCPVGRELSEGDTVQVGDLSLVVFDTPGHCAGHLSFVMQGKEKRCFFGGDLVFFGGRVIVQNIPDCDTHEYARSTLKLEGQQIDAFLPGHASISLRNGQRHIDAAIGAFRRLTVPPNLISA